MRSRRMDVLTTDEYDGRLPDTSVHFLPVNEMRAKPPHSEAVDGCEGSEVPDVERVVQGAWSDTHTYGWDRKNIT